MSDTTKETQSNTTAALVGRLVRENIRPYLGWVVFAIVCMAVVGGATALTAFLLGPVVDDIFVGRKQEMLLPLGGAVIAAYLAKGVANYGQATLMSFVGQRIITDAQKRLYAHLTTLELAFFQNSPTGSLISRFTVDINMMRAAVSNTLTGLGKDVATLVFLVGVMFYRDWLLSLIALVSLPLAVHQIVRLGKRMRKVTINTQEEMGQFNTLLNQSFQGTRVVKAYGMEGYEQRRIDRITERIYELAFKAQRIRALASPIMETLGGLCIAAVIVYGGFRVINGTTTAGSFVSFLGALLMAYEPLKRLANLNTNLQEGLASAQRLFALLDRKPGITEKPDAKDLTIAEGAIRLADVSFAYREDRPALHHISLEVPGGKTVALVGPSGAGKSTILNLIPRFYDVGSGAITIDGTDVRDVTFASLRGAMALVSQEIALFDDTIRANIAYGRMDASEDEIIAVAKSAAAHDFIMEFPRGYDTQVGEHGAQLSGGQRQRIAIARAMLKDSPILLLDEATSALDTESERQVQAALGTLMKGRTTLVIAHRLSTVMDADIIHVVDGGKLIESGTHAELLARGGLYAKLYALQFADQVAVDGAPAAEPVITARA